MNNLPELSIKQNNFCKEYILNGFNATEAYRTAYKSLGSTATCCVEGSRLLKNPKISLWIEHYKKTMSEHIEKEIIYSIDDAFKECDELKIIALESKDQYGRPNVSAANKAVEMKMKLKGLMKDDAVTNSIVMQMGDVEIDGVPFDIKIGEDVTNGEDTEQ
jgi:phage terminase small subunit